MSKIGLIGRPQLGDTAENLYQVLHPYHEHREQDSVCVECIGYVPCNHFFACDIRPEYHIAVPTTPVVTISAEQVRQIEIEMATNPDLYSGPDPYSDLYSYTEVFQCDIIEDMDIDGTHEQYTELNYCPGSDNDGAIESVEAVDSNDHGDHNDPNMFNKTCWPMCSACMQPEIHDPDVFSNIDYDEFYAINNDITHDTYDYNVDGFDVSGFDVNGRDFMGYDRYGQYEIVDEDLY
jgi:hypothetical protein